MNKVIQFGSPKDTTEVVQLTSIEKMQLAVQIAAIVRASFKQPTDSDVQDVLQMAASQLSAAAPASD